MALEITVLQGADVFAQMFNAVATFVRNETWYSLMTIAETIGIFAVGIMYVKGRDLKSIGMWFLSVMIINGLLLTPKERVIITDISQTNTIRNVDNVPLGIAFPIYLTTLVGNSIARTYDTFLAQPDGLQYSKTGLLFGQRLLEQSFDVVVPSPEVASNINNYVTQCLIERNMISKEFNWSDLKRSDSLIDFLSLGKPVDYMNFSQEKSVTVQKDCREAGGLIKAQLAKLNADQRNGTLPEFIKQLRSEGLFGSGNVAIPQVNSQLANIQNYFMGTSKSATDILTQNMLVNQFRRGINSYPTNLDSTSALVNHASEQSLTKMKLAHLSSYQVSGRLLPALHSVLIVLMVGLFPIMVLAMFVRELAWGVVKNYITVLFSLMMWPVMFAIFNSVMNVLQYMSLRDGQGFTLQNANTLVENATTMAGVAMWLTASIPFLSFRLVTNLGQNLASAGSYLGNAMSSATTADANQVAAGNYNWGNMQTHNYQANKIDLNHVIKQGAITTQTSMGGLHTVNADGSESYNTGTSISTLPFSVNWSQSTNNSWNERTTMAVSQEARNSQGVREDITNAISHLTGYNSGHTSSSMKGTDWADNSGLNKVTTVGDGTTVNNRDGYSHDTSVGKNSGENTRVGGTLSASIFGNGANAGHDSSTGTSSNNSYATSIGKQLDKMYQSGKSFAEMQGYIETVKGGTTDSDFLTTLNNVQKDLRQAETKYNEYVETESKSLNEAKEAILSNTNSVNVSHNLDSALYRHIRQNYSVEDQNKILNSSPTAEGMELRQRAIAEVTNQHIDDIVSSHHSNAEKLAGSYSTTSISNTAGSSPSDISVNPNQAISPPAGAGRAYANSGSSYKQGLQKEYADEKSTVNSEINKTGRHNAVQRIVIDGKSENVGVLAKDLEKGGMALKKGVEKLAERQYENSMNDKYNTP